MKYSVLMSVYKNDNYEWLEEAIISIMNQTVKTDDFVIVEDGPITSELESVIDKYKEKLPIKVVSLEKNMGLGVALNKGVLACKNSLIARIDSDDISASDRMEKQLQVFMENDNLSICGTLAKEFTNNINNVVSLATFPLTSADIKNYARKRNPFCHPSVMFKKEDVLAVGNYRSFHLCEDYDLWVRMIMAGMECVNINEYLHYWRISDDFYKRRSGIKYLKSILRFLKLQYQNEFLSAGEYYKSVVIRSIVYLMPNFLRSFIYRTFLRKKVL